MSIGKNLSRGRRFLVVGVLAVLCFFVWIQNSENPVAQSILKIFGYEEALGDVTKVHYVSGVANNKEAQNIQGTLAQTGAIVADPRPDSLVPNHQYDLKTREGRQAFHNDLAKQKSYDVWARWDDVISRRDPDELGVFVSAMGDALRRDGSPDLYAQMAKRLLQSNISVQDRLYVVGALERASTREAVQVLLEFAQAVEARTVSNGDSLANLLTLQRGTLQAVQIASKEFVNGSRNWEISSALESAWLKLDKAEAGSMRATISSALVYLGKPEGLDVLIKSIDGAGLPDTARSVALSAVAQLESNDAVPLIGGKLNRSTPISTTTSADLTEALARGLLSVGSADAMKELATYLNGPTIDQATREKILPLLKNGNFSGEALRVLKENRLR
jgi:hypothetical protein